MVIFKYPICVFRSKIEKLGFTLKLKLDFHPAHLLASFHYSHKHNTQLQTSSIKRIVHTLTHSERRPQNIYS